MNYIEPVKADVPAGYIKIPVLNKDYEQAGFYIYLQHSFRNLGKKTIFISKHQFIQNELGAFLAGDGVDELGRHKAQIKPVWNCTIELDATMAEEFIRSLQGFVDGMKNAKHEVKLN